MSTDSPNQGETSNENHCNHPATYGIGLNHTYCASCGEKVYIDNEGKKHLLRDKFPKPSPSAPPI